MAILLEVQNWNSQAIEANLDDTLFYIILNWNESGQYWSMGVRNYAYQTLINNIMMVPNFPLTRQFRYEYMPKGELIVNTANFTNGSIPRDGFSSGRYEFVYYTEQELIDLAILDDFGKTYPDVV